MSFCPGCTYLLGTPLEQVLLGVLIYNLEVRLAEFCQVLISSRLHGRARAERVITKKDTGKAALCSAKGCSDVLGLLEGSKLSCCPRVQHCENELESIYREAVYPSG